MNDAQIAKMDRLALLMIREEKERSRALPSRAYRDPADLIEFPAELERQKKEKQKRIAQRREAK